MHGTQLLNLIDVLNECKWKLDNVSNKARL